MQMRKPLSLLMGVALATTLLAECGAPVATAAPTDVRAASGRAPSQGVTTASVEWNEVARAIVARNRSRAFVASRTYALVSVAQLAALDAVRSSPDHTSWVSRRAAIGAASATVLGALYPNEKAWVDAHLAGLIGTEGWLETGQVDFARGVELGRNAGAAVFARALSDGYTDAPAVQLPAPGPDIWFSDPKSPWGGASLVDVRTWFLGSPDQFRPAAPPRIGSPEFAAALAEVAQFSQLRAALTPEGKMMDSVAKFWAFGGGTYTPAGYWNDVASALAGRYHLDERRATELLALLNMTAMDAIVASNDAEYHYWLARPSQVDASITLSLTPLPNFPSYPSNHATISAAMAEILAARFPREAGELRAAAEQAALSRVYGGIHYRFDGDAGVAMGREIARHALLRSSALRELAAGA